MQIRGGRRVPGQWRIGAPEIPISISGIPKKDFPQVHTSLANSQQSSSFSSTFSSRCDGLDLLAMAVGHVAFGSDVLVGSMEGSVFWVPFMQRRVVRRAKRALWLQKENDVKDVVGEASKEEEKKQGISTLAEDIIVSKKKRRSPLRHRSESTVQPWKKATTMQSSVQRSDSILHQTLD